MRQQITYLLNGPRRKSTWTRLTLDPADAGGGGPLGGSGRSGEPAIRRPLSALFGSRAASRRRSSPRAAMCATRAPGDASDLSLGTDSRRYRRAALRRRRRRNEGGRAAARRGVAAHGDGHQDFGEDMIWKFRRGRTIN